MDRGYIKLYRAIQDTPDWKKKPFSPIQAWIDLLFKAAWKDGIIYTNGREVYVKRGQCGWSQERLATKWGWSRTKLRTFLNRLESRQQIIQQKSYTTTLITIVNYEDYQGIEQQKEQQKNSRRTAEEQQKDTIKNKEEVKEVKEVKKTTALSADWELEFEQAWKEYPARNGRKAGKKAAKGVWQKLKPNLQEVLDALEWQKVGDEWIRDNGSYIPDMQRWLKNARWQDEETSASSGGSKFTKGAQEWLAMQKEQDNE